MGTWANNPKGAYGYTDYQSKIGNMSIPMLAAGTITAQSVVQWATTATSTGQVQVALTNGTLSAILGIALEAGTVWWEGELFRGKLARRHGR